MANCGDGITKTTKAEFTALILRGDGPNQVTLWMEAAARTGDGCIAYYVDKAREVANWNKMLFQGDISHMINLDALWQRREQYFGLQPNPQKALAEANAKCAGQPVSEEIARRSRQLDFSKYASHWQSENVDLSYYVGGLEHRRQQPQPNFNSAKQMIPEESRRAYGQQRRDALGEESASREAARQAKLREHRQQVAARQQHQQQPQQETPMSKSAPHTTTSEVFALLAQNKDNRRFNSAYVEAFVSNKELFNQLKKAVEKATATPPQPQWTAPVTKRAPIVPNHDQLDDDEIIQGEVVYTPQRGHLLPSPVAPRALPPPSGQVPVEKSAWQRHQERKGVFSRRR